MKQLSIAALAALLGASLVYAADRRWELGKGQQITAGIQAYALKDAKTGTCYLALITNGSNVALGPSVPCD